MAIYTRTGDAGTTSLFTGQRVSKTHPRVEAYGTLDELNAALSLCACAAADEHHRALLEAIQQQIFWFSAELASDSERPSPKQRYISSEEISALEAAIDRAMARVEPLHSFILPGRCEAASRLHFARTLARRAERRLVELAAEVTVRQVLMRYINRLSDCLYALARAEDSDVHQNNIIREVSRRYLAASQPSRSKETTPVALSFHDLHQLTRAAVERAQQLQVPVVSDAVQPGAALYGLETHLQGKVVTFGGGYALWRDGSLIGGLGISGGSVEQDMDIAQTAIAAINVGTHQ